MEANAVWARRLALMVMVWNNPAVPQCAQRWFVADVKEERERTTFTPRAELPLPTQPPYTAHLGNLSFDATQADISDLFADCEVTNVRIVEDKLTRTPKGFGYVEFASVEGLKKALTYSSTTFQGRAIRVSVADPRTISWNPRVEEMTR